MNRTKSTVSRRLDDPDRRPDDALIESILGRRFSTWNSFVGIVSALPSLCAEWRYYRDGKSLCGRHRFNGPYHVWETSPMTLDCKTCWKVKATGRG